MISYIELFVYLSTLVITLLLQIHGTIPADLMAQTIVNYVRINKTTTVTLISLELLTCGTAYLSILSVLKALLNSDVYYYNTTRLNCPVITRLSLPIFSFFLCPQDFFFQELLRNFPDLFSRIDDHHNSLTDER